MFRNYLKIAWRSLWRNRLYTALNVLGLAIGLSACWISYRLVSYEFAFDQQHPNLERTYRVVSRFMFDGKESGNPGVPEPMIQVAQTDVPGIERAIPFYEKSMSSVYVPQPTGKPKRFRDVDDVVATNTGFFDFFRYNWLASTPKNVLEHPNEVILTRSRAERYFPGLLPAQVVGHSLTYFDTLHVTVTGIVADPERPSSFDPKEILSISTLHLKSNDDAWGGVSSNDQLLIRLAPNASPARVQQLLNQVSTQKGAPILKRFNMAANDRWHLLQPLADVHFGMDYADQKRNASRTVLYGLMGLSGFILLLAIVNYVNLASAQVPQRAREIGIRKTLGSRNRTLIGQFLLETGFITLFALGAAFGLAQVFLDHYNDLLPTGSTDYINWPQVTGFLVGLVVLVSALSGWYPGWLIMRFQPAVVLRGQTQLSAAPRLSLRKSLIVFQFLIAQVFIVGAILVGQQLRYLLHHDMGFDREAIVTMAIPFRGWDNPNDIPDKESLKNQLARLPGVGAVSLGNLPANQSFTSNTWDYVGKKGKVSFTIYRKNVDTAYVGVYRLTLLAGRNLYPSDTAREFVINETAFKAMGLQRPQDAIGQIITESAGASTPIVGVVKDFNIQSFRQAVPAVALMMNKSNLNAVNVRLASRNPADWQPTLTRIEKRWKTIYPDEPFKYEFYDQTIEQFYKQERTAARVINLATIVAILISCLGLFGLATFTAEQRTKEIGVRKVLGASVGSIVALLSQDFLKLVLIAIVIASPIAWYAMNKWLQDFAYKIDIEWWMFAGAGLLAIGIALLTVSFQSVKAALMNPVKSLRSE